MSSLDYYDVQSMIRDARSEIRGEISNAVDELRRELREAIGAERVDRQDAIESLQRVVDQRTERLV